MKELSEMTLEELWLLFPIILKKHKKEYSNWYKIEQFNLENILDSEDIVRINHYGSTAVKGLIAKPTVDILLEASLDSDIKEISRIIGDNGWILMHSQDNLYPEYVFNKGYTKEGFAEKVYHLHLRYLGDWKELYFRDYLQEHKDVANEYGKLKLSLLEEYKNNRDGYTQAKTEFINKYTQLAKMEYRGRYTKE